MAEFGDSQSSWSIFIDTSVFYQEPEEISLRRGPVTIEKLGVLNAIFCRADNADD